MNPTVCGFPIRFIEPPAWVKCVLAFKQVSNLQPSLCHLAPHRLILWRCEFRHDSHSAANFRNRSDAFLRPPCSVGHLINRKSNPFERFRQFARGSLADFAAVHPSRRRSSLQGLNFGCFPERSGIALQHPGHAGLDRFDCVSRDLLSERPEFLVLRRDRIELMTRVCSRKFYCLRWRLNGHELAD